MKLLQTPTFVRQAKKLHKNQKNNLEEDLQRIMQDPLVGDLKKGDLNGIHVYKFTMVNQLTLLAYKYKQEDDLIILLALGSHENFYRDMKR